MLLRGLQSWQCLFRPQLRLWMGVTCGGQGAQPVCFLVGFLVFTFFFIFGGFCCFWLIGDFVLFPFFSTLKIAKTGVTEVGSLDSPGSGKRFERINPNPTNSKAHIGGHREDVE